jgi:glycolate oxidase iron-sulfur subunit
VHEPVRTVLRRFVRECVELDDEGLCCGAGGAYSVLEPEMAGQIRERKLSSISRTHPDVVASANPGCSMHLAAAGVSARHPMEIVDEAIRASARAHAGRSATP